MHHLCSHHSCCSSCWRCGCHSHSVSSFVSLSGSLLFVLLLFVSSFWNDAVDHSRLPCCGDALIPNYSQTSYFSLYTTQPTQISVSTVNKRIREKNLNSWNSSTIYLSSMLEIILSWNYNRVSRINWPQQSLNFIKIYSPLSKRT